MKLFSGTETHPLYAHQVTHTRHNQEEKKPAATSDLFQHSANGLLLSHFLITVRELIGFQCNCRSKKCQTVTHTCLKPCAHKCTRDNFCGVSCLYCGSDLLRCRFLKKNYCLFLILGREKEKIPIKTRVLVLKVLLTSLERAKIIPKKGARQSSLTLQFQPSPST